MDVFIRKTRYQGPVGGVVLDWAGTAVDYGCMGPVAVFGDVFKKYGVDVTTAEARAFMGLMKKDHVRAMCKMESVADRWKQVHGRRPDDNDIDDMYQDTELMMMSAISRHCDLIPGLLETMKEFKARHLKVGSSTGYTNPMMDVLVPRAREEGYSPDSIVCSTDVPAGRPYPWMCYQNAINMEVYPMEAMVKIGDTVADIHEGLNAGTWTIGVVQSGNEMGLTRQEIDEMEPAELMERTKEIAQRFQAEGAHYVTEGIWSCIPIIDDINTRLSAGELPSPSNKLWLAPG
jgi:phosphonoacetaldehyde hydrolase